MVGEGVNRDGGGWDKPSPFVGAMGGAAFSSQRSRSPPGCLQNAVLSLRTRVMAEDDHAHTRRIHVEEVMLLVLCPAREARHGQ